jgi:pyroglutamyl-peptidase
MDALRSWRSEEGQLGPILLTGFEPYGGRGSNPSFDTMQALKGRKIGGVETIGRALPVAIGSLRAKLEEFLEELRPSAIISLGLWPGEPMIRLERSGLNIADFEIADNEGAIWRDRLISDNGLHARSSTLPLREIEQRLLAEGIPSRISSTAGTYLCNACLYALLELAEKHERHIPCGLIHVPYTPEQVAALVVDIRKGRQLEQHQRADLASMELTRTIRAVEIAIDVTVQSL